MTSRRENSQSCFVIVMLCPRVLLGLSDAPSPDAGKENKSLQVADHLALITPVFVVILFLYIFKYFYCCDLIAPLVCMEIMGNLRMLGIESASSLFFSKVCMRMRNTFHLI